MRIIFAGHKERGERCLRALASAGYDVVLVLSQSVPPGSDPGVVAKTAAELGITSISPSNVNSPSTVDELKAFKPDLIILGGYNQIVRRNFYEIAPLGCINLHGGRLPQYRGSSPMNWVLINGETEFAISIIRVDEGVDTGEVLAERFFPISPTDRIKDLQDRANLEFPEMLLETVSKIEKNSIAERVQKESDAAYYPLRFPDDGFILWDMLTAEQIYNRIRALSAPYPGAFTIFEGRRINLLEGSLAKRAYYGEPGRVYLKNQNGVLVCGSDRCLWIKQAVFADDLGDALQAIQRYSKFVTVGGFIMSAYNQGKK